MPRICSSAALNALWKVECWACLAVSLDTALDSLTSKDFPFVQKRNTFWRAQYAAKVSRHDRRISRLAGVLISCQRGNHTLIFHEVPILPGVVISFLCLFPYETFGSFSGYLGGIMKSKSWKQTDKKIA